jgi:hypothetical protein
VWDPNTEDYTYLDAVEYLSNGYLGKNENVIIPKGTLPTDTNYWQLYVKGASPEQNVVFTEDLDFQSNSIQYYNNHVQDGAINFNIAQAGIAQGIYKYYTIDTDGSDINFPGEFISKSNEYANDVSTYSLLIFFDGTYYQYRLEKINVRTLLEHAVFETAIWTNSKGGSASDVSAIADDGGINKQYLLQQGVGLGSVSFKAGIYSIGDRLRVIIRGSNIVQNRLFLKLGSSVSPEIRKDIESSGIVVFDNIDTSIATDVYMILTAGNDDNPTVSEGYVRSITVEKY